ncbi:hypothetical protein CCR75_009732 [Bremia lactucae]|uniref:Uncharacterized protein n=1 Tax=Bremia lactucae TaxID=4779 RepID=A0A976IID5_BRELC|nr:hypothetical protein CCR75_002294 [Bremia lactucae]TDH72364.1 hypothetical protein CCR75_009732 [Bremia lactucae]
MVGNKHKNGIICTFPDCNKPMRTQKFKMHFTRAHLKEGEVYSVDHRRQFEVAREESSCSHIKSELSPLIATVTEAPLKTPAPKNSSNNLCKETVATVHDDILTAQARQVPTQQIPVPPQPNDPVIPAVKSKTTATATRALPNSINITTVVPASAATSPPSQYSSGSKRPVTAIESSSVDVVDSTNALLMQFIALMDQRFQELVGKMGEMIDVQKDLIDALQSSNPNGQAPASAFSQAVEVVMKRRKKDLSPRGDSISGSNDADGEDQGIVL